MDPSNSNLKQLILPLGIECLFVEELLLLDLVLVLVFPVLHIFLQLQQFLLIVNRVLSQLIDCEFQIRDASFLEVLILVLVLQRGDQRPQLFFLLLHVNIVGL